MVVYRSGFLFAALVILACGSTPAFAQDCIPNTPCGGPPDVSGTWYIRNAFDISQAVPAALGDGFVPLNELDTRIVAALHLRPDEQWQAPVVAARAAKHASPFLAAVLRIGKGMGVIMPVLRTEGTLHLAQSGGDFTHVKGSGGAGSARCASSRAGVRAVRDAGRDARRALTGGWADVAILRYGGAASVGPKTLDGYWKGTFYSKVLKNMPGAWQAKR